MANPAGSSVARGGWLLALVVALAAPACTSPGVTCPEGQVACNGACVDLQTNPLYCGACNASCPAGATCSAGECRCPPDVPVRCGFQCVNLQSDSTNCGSCGHRCGLGTCGAGACVCDEPSPPVELCPAAIGTCVDTSASASHCGGCNVVCTTGEICSGSTCVCNPPREVCAEGSGTVCTDLDTDPEHCGSCTTACVDGQVCAAGSCQLVCAAGYTLCGTVCVDLQTDPADCGSCGHACGTGQSCSRGTCQATCSTLTCGGTCCQAPLLGNACCGTSCPYPHKNFVGALEEQTYYDCYPPFVWNLGTAEVAARAWAPDGNQITPTQSCPASGGSLCLVWQRPLGSLDVGCAVFCYSGPLEGAATVTSNYTCPCPTVQQVDWY